MLCITVSSPFSHSCKKRPKDAEDLIEAALGAASAIKSAHGTTFTVSCIESHASSISSSRHALDWKFMSHAIQVSDGMTSQM